MQILPNKSAVLAEERRRLLDRASRLPTASELESATSLSDWHPVLSDIAVPMPNDGREQACLFGLALHAGQAFPRAVVTSPLVAICPNWTWARSHSQFYRLGPPLTRHFVDVADLAQPITRHMGFDFRHYVPILYECVQALIDQELARLRAP